MSNARDVWGGFLIMVGSCIFGFLLSLVGGYVLDNFWDSYDDAGYADEYGDNAWSNGWGDFNLARNVFFFICWIFPIVGTAAFVKTVIRRQGYDMYLGQ